MAAPAWSESVNNSGNATQVTLTTTSTPGAVAFAAIHVRSSSSTGVITINPPAGGAWTSRRKTTIQDANGVQTVETFSRSDPTNTGQTFTYSISAGTIAGGSGQEVVITGADQSNPIDTSAEWTNAASGNTVDCPTVTPSVVDTLLVCFYAINGTSGAWTHPTGMTERIDASGYGHSTETLTTTSATGTKTATAVNSRFHRIGQSWVIKSASNVDATVTPAAIATTVSLPATTSSAGATVTPDAISTSASLPQAIADQGADVTPGVLAASVTLPHASLVADVNLTPDPIAATVSFPQTGLQLDWTVHPDTCAVSVQFPQPDVQQGADVSPDAINVTLTIPSVAIAAGADVTPSVIAAVVALAQATILAINAELGYATQSFTLRGAGTQGFADDPETQSFAQRGTATQTQSGSGSATQTFS